MGQGQGHRSQKGKKNSYSRNVKLHSAITPVFSQTQSGDVCMQPGVFGYGRSNGVTAIFVTWPEVSTHN